MASAAMRVLMAAGLMVAAWGAPVVAAPPVDKGLAELQASLPGKLLNDPRSLVRMTDMAGAGAQKVVRAATILGGGAALQITIAKPADAS
jgi:hypothetical protein